MHTLGTVCVFYANDCCYEVIVASFLCYIELHGLHGFPIQIGGVSFEFVLSFFFASPINFARVSSRNTLVSVCVILVAFFNSLLFIVELKHDPRTQAA